MKYNNLKNIKAVNQRKRQSDKLKHDITRRLLDYLERKYEMRYNTALGCTEMRKAGSNEPFVPADERMRNTIGGCVKIDTSSFLFFLYLVYHIIHYLLQLCC